MRKILAASLLLTLSLPAAAEQHLYGALALGSAREADLSGMGQTASGTSAGATFGFHMNKNFAYEVSYISLLSNASIANSTASRTIHGAELAGVANCFLGEQFSIYGRLGYANLDQTYSTGVAVSNLVGFIYGGGVQYDLNSTISLRAGYQIANLTGKSGDTIVNDAYASLLYNF